MGRPRWEVAGNEMGRIYHMTWDVQDGKWRVMRWEDESTTGDGTSKMGSGMRWEDEFTWKVAGNEMGRRIYHMTWDFQVGKWQVLRWEDEFTTGDGNGR